MRAVVAARRLLQAAVLLLLAAAPALGIWGIAATSVYGPQELAERTTPQGAWIAESLTELLGRADPDGWLMRDGGVLVGGTWSIRVAGVEIADPLALAHLLAGGHRPPLPFLAGGLFVLALHVLLGRAFCGWACPYGTLSRLLARPRAWLLAHGLAARWNPSRRVRWFVLGAVLLAPVLGGSVVSLVLPYLAVVGAFQGFVFGGAAGAAGVLLAALASDLLLWDHGVCRSLCPSGALQRALGRWRIVRLVAHREAACQKGCHLCAEACWLGLDPRSGRPGPDCDACGRCVPRCPNTRLGWGLRLPRALAGGGLLLLAAGLAATATGCRLPERPATHANPALSGGAGPFNDPVALAEGHWLGPEGREVDLATARDARGVRWLRIGITGPDGRPWTGPLVAEVAGRRVAFEAAEAPRSTVRHAFYDLSLDGLEADRVRIEGAGLEGAELPIPSPGGRPWLPAVLPPLLVAGMGFLGAGRRVEG